MTDIDVDGQDWVYRTAYTVPADEEVPSSMPDIQLQLARDSDLSDAEVRELVDDMLAELGVSE